MLREAGEVWALVQVKSREPGRMYVHTHLQDKNITYTHSTPSEEYVSPYVCLTARSEHIMGPGADGM